MMSLEQGTKPQTQECEKNGRGRECRCANISHLRKTKENVHYLDLLRVGSTIPFRQLAYNAFISASFSGLAELRSAVSPGSDFKS